MWSLVPPGGAPGATPTLNSFCFLALRGSLSMYACSSSWMRCSMTPAITESHPITTVNQTTALSEVVAAAALTEVGHKCDRHDAGLAQQVCTGSTVTLQEVKQLLGGHNDQVEALLALLLGAPPGTKHGPCDATALTTRWRPFMRTELVALCSAALASLRATWSTKLSNICLRLLSLSVPAERSRLISVSHCVENHRAPCQHHADSPRIAGAIPILTSAIP